MSMSSGRLAEPSDEWLKDAEQLVDEVECLPRTAWSSHADARQVLATCEPWLVVALHGPMAGGAGRWRAHVRLGRRCKQWLDPVRPCTFHRNKTRFTEK